MGKTKVMGLKVLKSGKFRIRDQVFFIPNQGLFCYATQPSGYVTVKQTDKKQPVKKMGARCEQDLFHKRLYPKGWSTHEKLLKLISHYGSSNLKL